MPFNIISYKKSIWKGIEGHLKGIVQKLEDSRQFNISTFVQEPQSPVFKSFQHKPICSETSTTSPSSDTSSPSDPLELPTDSKAQWSHFPCHDIIVQAAETWPQLQQSLHSQPECSSSCNKPSQKCRSRLHLSNRRAGKNYPLLSN